MKLWEKNLWIESPISQSEQPKQAYSNHSIFSGAEDGSQIEPLTLDKLNYTTFFADREQTKLLAFQLKQLKDYLELKGYAYLG